MRTVLLLCAIACSALPLAAQESGRPRFEAVTVKVNHAPFSTDTLGMDTSPGRFVATGMPLAVLVVRALDAGGARLVDLPEWVSTERYDIVATTGGPKTDGEIRAMLRTLMEEHFKLATHRETRQAPVFHLVRARADGSPGPDMTPSAIDCDVLQRERMATVSATLAAAQQNGKTLPLSERQLWPPGHPCNPPSRFERDARTLTVGGITMGGLANRLRATAGGQVVDRTGVSGTWAVTLRYALPGRTPIGATDAPPLAAALRDQLGLTLERHEGTEDVVVIDRIERPVEQP